MASPTLLALLAAALLLPGTLWAQQPTIKEKREQAAADALQQALADAKVQNKALVLTFSANAGAARDNGAMLKAPATATWLARHAVVKEITEPSVIRSLSDAGLKQKAGGNPLMFVEDISEPLLFPNLAPVKAGSLTQAGSLAMAVKLDWTLRSPVLAGAFMQQHEGALKPLPHPYAGRPAPADFVRRLAACRDLARKKAWREAADAYGALFASAPSANDGLRLGIMAQEMLFVGAQDKTAKDRFLTLRDQYAGVLDIRDYRQVFEYLILCRVVEDHEHNLRFYDDALNSKKVGVIVPPADQMVLPLLLEKCHFNDPTEGVTDPSKWPAQLMQKAAKMEKSKEAPKLVPAIEFARWFAPLEAARRYGWCHYKGQTDKAELIAKAVAEWPNAGEARSMLDAAAAGMPPAPPPPATAPKPPAPPTP